MKRVSISRRLRNITLTYATVSFLVIGVVMALMGTAPLYQPLRENVVQHLLVELRFGQQEIQNYVANLEKEAQNISTRADLMAAMIAFKQGNLTRAELSSLMEQEFRQLYEVHPEIAGVVRLDADQQVISQTGVSIPSAEWIIPPDEPAELAFSGPIVLSQNNYLVVASPIIDRHGYRYGTDLFLVNLIYLQDSVQEFFDLSDRSALVVGIPTGSSFSLFSLDKSSTTSDSELENRMLTSIRSAAVDREEGVSWPSLTEGNGWVIAYTPVQESNWAAAVSIPQNDLFAPVTRQIAQLVGVLMALIVAGSLGMSIVLRPLAHRILIDTDELEREVDRQTAALQQELAIRKQVENELVRLRYQNLLILQSAGEGILGMDDQGRLTFINRAAAEMLGVLPEEVQHQNAHDLFHHSYPDGRPYPAAECAISRAYQLGVTTNSDSEYFWRQGGGCFPVEFTSTPIFEDERVIGAVVTFRDISERKQNEIVLRENEEKYRSLFEASPDAIFQQTLDGNIIDCNSEACRLFQITREELLNRHIFDLITPAFAELLLLLNELDNTRDSARVEGEARRLNGEVFPVEVSARRTTVQGRDVVISYVRDITERKQAEQTLRSSEEKFSKSFHSNPSLMALSTLQDGIFIDVNRSFEQVTGYSRDEVIGKRSLDLGLFAEINSRGEYLKEIIEHGRLHNMVSRVFTRAGEERIGLFSIERVEFAGKPCLLTVMADVTEREERERERAAIASVASALRTADTRAEMMPILLDQVLGLLHAHGSAFVMREEVGDHLRVDWSNGLWKELAGKELSSGYTASRSVVMTAQPYINNDVINNPGIACPEMRTGVQALVGLPLIAQNNVLGALMVGRAVPFLEDELSILSAIADMAANAIQRATLHEQTELRLRRLAALHNIDLAITAGLDLQMVQSILLAQASAQLGNDAARILILTPNRHTLRLLVSQGFRCGNQARVEIPIEKSYAGRVAMERHIVSVPDLRRSTGSVQYEELPLGEEFITYHGVPLLAKGEVKGVLEIFHRRLFQPSGDWLEFMENLADQAAISIYNAELYTYLQRSNFELEVAYDTTLEGWARALELRDRETEGHSRRVADLTVQLSRAIGVDESEISSIRRGALLHDIGKMVIPDHILFKTGPLGEDEWVVMRQHPDHAARLLEPIPFLRTSLPIPYCHHERWDGSGYPRGLKGEQIPLAARIFAVVDVWDALRSDRPYRKAWPVDEVLNYIRAESGKLFDPQVVEVFLQQAELANSDENEDLKTSFSLQKRTPGMTTQLKGEPNA